VVLVVLGGLGAAACGDGGSDGSAADEPALDEEAAAGKQVLQSNGCVSCHSLDGSEGVGPTFRGHFGSEVTMEDGTTLVVDEAHVRESIADPTAMVLEGYRPIMPERDLSEDDLTAIVAYLRAVGTQPAGS
jgi:cytochrome c oxidase subunit 2